MKERRQSEIKNSKKNSATIIISIVTFLFISFNTLQNFAWKNQFDNLVKQLDTAVAQLEKITTSVYKNQLDIALNTERISTLLDKIKKIVK